MTDDKIALRALLEKGSDTLKVADRKLQEASLAQQLGVICSGSTGSGNSLIVS